MLEGAVDALGHLQALDLHLDALHSVQVRARVAPFDLRHRDRVLQRPGLPELEERLRREVGEADDVSDLVLPAFDVEQQVVGERVDVEQQGVPRGELGRAARVGVVEADPAQVPVVLRVVRPLHQERGVDAHGEVVRGDNFHMRQDQPHRDPPSFAKATEGKPEGTVIVKACGSDDACTPGTYIGEICAGIARNWPGAITFTR